MLENRGDFPGVAAPSERAVWLSISPDPNLIVRIPENNFPAPQKTENEILAARRAHTDNSVRLSYRKPLHIVRGSMQHLYDADGRRYLDAVNNVPHVGHSHPRVVEAVARQMAVLNTNTRYLYAQLAEYTERLTSLFPEPLKVCFLVSSGSEANELALRLARTHTRRKDLVVVEGGYHGNTTSLIEVSHYKFAGPGGAGKAEYVHVAPLPDTFRGPYKASDPNAGKKYAQLVAEAIARAEAGGRKIGAFLMDSVNSSAGMILLPPGYLEEVYRHVRAVGGVCIADEVQGGFGRLGTHFWAFEAQGVVPDIVTLGKPIGNGFPLGAVVTTREIAASFDTGMEFFSTYGSNPVACAAGLAVLDVLRDENLQANARAVGDELLRGLRELQRESPLIGEVRGSGFFIGVELVRDRATLEPADEEAAFIAEVLRNRGILIGTEGPRHNVLKIRPPMCFSGADASELLAALRRLAM
jgi:4-aminobutyrate aminotransferase-like enzyme